MHIRQLMRTGHVKRWHIVRVGREQTIAEHMYRVWLICREIGKRLGLSDERRSVLEALALRHDMAEVVMGDIPTPTKHLIESKTWCLDDKERDLVPDWDVMRQDTLENDPMLLDILKMADIMEAILFLREEAIGEHARSVRELLETQFTNLFLDYKVKYKSSSDKIFQLYKDLKD